MKKKTPQTRFVPGDLLTVRDGMIDVYIATYCTVPVSSGSIFKLKYNCLTDINDRDLVLVLSVVEKIIKYEPGTETAYLLLFANNTLAWAYADEVEIVFRSRLISS